MADGEMNGSTGTAVPGDRREALLAFAAAAYETRPLPPVDDWPALLAAAQRHGLVALGDRLIHANEACPGAARRAFRGLSALQAARQAQMEKALGQVLAALAEARVPTIVLKGPSLARTVYPHPSLRPFTDLDLLVHEEDWETTHGTLLRLGFQPVLALSAPPPRVWERKAYYHMQYDRAEDRMRVEVHYDPWYYGLRPHSSERCWERAVPLAVPGASTQMLAPEDQVLQVCLHLHEHGYDRLIWFTDLALLLRAHEGLDWDYFVAAAREEGLSVLVYYSLHYLERLLGASAPPSVLAALRPNRLQAWLHDRCWPPPAILGLAVADRAVCDFHEVPETEELLLNLALTGRRREKLIYLARMLVPSSAWLRWYYGVTDEGTLRARRLAHAPKLLLKMAGELARLARHGASRHALSSPSPANAPTGRSFRR